MACGDDVRQPAIPAPVRTLPIPNIHPDAASFNLDAIKAKIQAAIKAHEGQ